MADRKLCAKCALDVTNLPAGWIMCPACGQLLTAAPDYDRALAGAAEAVAAVPPTPDTQPAPDSSRSREPEADASSSSSSSSSTPAPAIEVHQAPGEMPAYVATRAVQAEKIATDPEALAIAKASAERGGLASFPVHGGPPATTVQQLTRAQGQYIQAAIDAGAPAAEIEKATKQLVAVGSVFDAETKLALARDLVATRAAELEKLGTFRPRVSGEGAEVEPQVVISTASWDALQDAIDLWERAAHEYFEAKRVHDATIAPAPGSGGAS